MAVKRDDVETRPSPASILAENRDASEKASAENKLADGVDKETAELVRRTTTTRARKAVHKRQHEPMDEADADDNQPDENANGPRKAELHPKK